MRQALRPNQTKRQVAVGRAVPAPTGGWDAMNPLAAMPLSNAVIMDNWIPRAGFCELRRGYIPWATLPKGAETLMGFRSSTNDALFAAAGGKIYDCTVQGATPTIMLAGFTSNRWNWTSFSNVAGPWLVACNGTEPPIGYNAGSWAALPTLTGTGPPTLVPSDLYAVFAHKGRLYFLQRNTRVVWTPAAGAVGGVCTMLDLGPIFSKGGRLIAGANWSAQMGPAADDYAVFLTDQGQVAIYQGVDPTSAANFGLVGIYDFGPPMGAQALCKFGGDLAIITTDGVIPMSQGLSMDRAEQGNVAMTKMIMQAFTDAARKYGAQVGWQGLLTAVGSPNAQQGTSLMIVNIPTLTGNTAMQFVQNVLTGAWCRWLGINALCWEVANGKLFFGGVDGVYQAGVGGSDNLKPIIADIKGAFSSFGGAGMLKRFTAIRPILNTVPQVRPALEIDVDYQESAPQSVPTVVPSNASATQIRYEWTGASGIGYVGAPRMSMNVVADASQPVLSVGDFPEHWLGYDATDGDNVLISTGLPFDIPCQLLGFDLMLEPGGQF